MTMLSRQDSAGTLTMSTLQRPDSLLQHSFARRDSVASFGIFGRRGSLSTSPVLSRRDSTVSTASSLPPAGSPQRVLGFNRNVSVPTKPQLTRKLKEKLAEGEKRLMQYNERLSTIFELQVMEEKARHARTLNLSYNPEKARLEMEEFLFRLRKIQNATVNRPSSPVAPSVPLPTFVQSAPRPRSDVPDLNIYSSSDRHLTSYLPPTIPDRIRRPSSAVSDTQSVGGRGHAASPAMSGYSTPVDELRAVSDNFTLDDLFGSTTPSAGRRNSVR